MSSKTHTYSYACMRDNVYTSHAWIRGKKWDEKKMTRVPFEGRKKRHIICSVQLGYESAQSVLYYWAVLTHTQLTCSIWCLVEILAKIVRFIRMSFDDIFTLLTNSCQNKLDVYFHVIENIDIDCQITLMKSTFDASETRKYLIYHYFFVWCFPPILFNIY